MKDKDLFQNLRSIDEISVQCFDCTKKSSLSMTIDNIASIGATSISVFEIRERPDGFVSKSSELEEMTEKKVRAI